MNWQKGQKIIALCDVWASDINGNKKDQWIKHDEIYTIDAINQGCCMVLLDVGKANNEKNILITYACTKCKVMQKYNENESILFHENWFAPIDENKSALHNTYKKLLSLFNKENIEEIIYTSEPTEIKKYQPVRRKIISPMPMEEEMV